MIFEEISLFNFGIYQGVHTISLDSPDYRKPVILIGALNGAGKTTFLDALQLALYGKFAKCSNRGKMSYASFLEKNINSFSKERAASITLRFRHGDDVRNPQVYEIKRSWNKEGNKDCKESISVLFNGKQDQLLSENWESFVNEFIPQSISELFFFDGEKIENLADPKKSADLLKTGIEALLGLESLSKLSTDLLELKRKKQEQLVSADDGVFLKKIKSELEELTSFKTKLLDKLATLKELESEKHEIHASIQDKLRSSGADKLELKELLEKERKEIQQDLFLISHEITKVISGAYPLSVVSNLLERTEEQAKLEDKSNTFKAARELLKHQRDSIFDIFSSYVDDDLLCKVDAKLSELEKIEEGANSFDSYLNTNPIFFSDLKDRYLQEKKDAQELVNKKNETNERLFLVERKINTIPTLESVKEIILENAKIEAKLAQLAEERKSAEKRITEVNAEIQLSNSKYNLLLVKVNADNFEQKRQNQIINHIETLKDIVGSFNKTLIQDNIEKLESKIKSKFDQLKRKDSLISRIKISSEDYSMTLYSSNMMTLSTERLSAGERQLLAISILWGLADSSGKELPTIIDTPMGRLDGEHRSRLIDNYFPNAASQVILLSTDEEIYGGYYESLRPYIAQEYSIVYDEKSSSSHFFSGYIKASK